MTNHVITGRTELVAHIGYPTQAFKAPMIYNPWFASRGIDAVVTPMAVEPADYPDVLRAVFRMRNVRGALVTMPHKVATAGLVDALSTTAAIAGSCNAVRREPDGTLLGDMFDGEGFVRGVRRKGQALAGARALVKGAGGVGCAIAASLAAAGVAALGLFDTVPAAADALAGRLRQHYPSLEVFTGSDDPGGYGVLVNATPLGMRPGDALPFDVARIAPGAFVGEVVMAEEYTPLLRAARDKGCPVQVGADMLFEMIPAYLEFFGFGTATPDELRAGAELGY